MGDAEPELCPLCAEPMDATDRATNLCACGYQYCNFCFNRVRDEAERESLPARCPNCRTVYNLDSITMQDIDPDELEEALRKQRKRPERKASSSTVMIRRKEDLASVRVVQRNLVYVVGLAMDICYEDTLRGSEYFGRFGKPLKVSVNRAMPSGVSNTKNGPSGSAYVTFRRPQDAQMCIESIDGATWQGRMVRACFGTTKYCNAFLKGVPCNNADCLYLHAVADEADSFTKEQMLAGEAATQFVSLTHPPALKQRAMASMAGGVHSATASSSVSHAIAPPAPGQHPQRSVKMPVSQLAPTASGLGGGSGGGDMPPLAGSGTPPASGNSSSGGPSWASVSAAAHQNPATPPPLPPKQRKPATDHEWPSLGTGEQPERAASPSKQPDTAIAATAPPGTTPSSNGVKPSGETMAAQLARTKSAPSSAAGASVVRFASGKMLAAPATPQRPWAGGKTLVPPPPPPVASVAAAAVDASNVSQSLTLSLPGRWDSKAAAAAAAKLDAALPPAPAPAEEPAHLDTPTAQPAAVGASAAITATAAPAAAAVVASEEPSVPGQTTSVAAPSAAGRTLPLPARQQAPRPQQPQQQLSSPLLKLPQQQQQQKARRAPPGFETALTPAAVPRKSPPPGFEQSLTTAGMNGLAVAAQAPAFGIQQQQQQRASPLSASELATAARTRRQSRFSFARAEAKAAEAAANLQQAASGSALLAALTSPPTGVNAAAEQGGVQLRQGPPPGFGPVITGQLSPHQSAGSQAGSGAGGWPLQPGAALLRQLQAATVASGDQPQPAERCAFGDPAIMAARVTCTPPPGFEPHASRGPPPGFQFPVAGMPTAASAHGANGFGAQAATQPQTMARTQAAIAPADAKEVAMPDPSSPPALAASGSGSAACPSTAAVTASPRSSRGGKKKRGGKGRGGKGGGDS